MGSTIPLVIDVDHAIRLYQAGESLGQVAEKCGVSLVTIARRMKAAGFHDRRTNAEIGERTRRARYGDISAAILAYVGGLTVQEVCDKFSLPRKHLEKEIVSSGHILRTQAQSLGLRYTRMSVAERQAITASANAAMRGKPASKKRVERRAKTNEATLQLASRTDLLLCVWLAQRGIMFTPQKAVGPYNLDIAIDEPRVAVEVNGSWHYFPDRADTEARRRKYLLDGGWSIIEVNIAFEKGRPWNYLRPSCADKVVAMLEVFRSNKAASCEYCVIGGDGEPIA